jgi:hypothetical protein
MASVYPVDPLKDPRWMPFLQEHSHASIFHTAGWLEALRRTYGYEPVAFTRSAPGAELRDAIVFCRVKSWLTGCRMVSLPFSDHCQPLLEGEESFQPLLLLLGREKCDYVEIRPLQWPLSATGGNVLRPPGKQFCFHQLSLQPDLAALFRGFHRSSVQQNIKRAERQGLSYEEGRSGELLRKFYHLQLITRRRQQLPPQPFAWFRNLAACLGDKLTVRVASKDSCPVASILTLQHGRTLVYKYGCSDKQFSNLGGMHWLLWRAIQDAKSEGFQEFDLGRTDWENEGLIRFKDRLGATRSTLTYWRYPESSAPQAGHSWKLAAAKRISSRLPNACLVAAGNLLYRHLG